MKKLITLLALSAFISRTDVKSQICGYIDLDGSSEFLYSPFNNYNFSNFTFEGWYNVATYDGNVHYISLYKNSYIVLGDWLGGQTGTTWADGLNPIEIVGTASLGLNTWFHMAFTFDGSTQKIYINGTEVISAATTGTVVSNSTSFNQGLVLGARYTQSTQYLDGQMDEVRLWTIARTQSEIQSAMNSTVPTNSNGLVAYYTFEDGTGSTTVSDMTGNGNTLTLTNMDPATDWLSGDNISPSADIAELPQILVSCEGESVTLVAPTATDNCAGVITGTTTTVFPITAQGTTTVTWTYDDGNGNTVTQTQNVIVEDITAPAVPTLVAVAAECSATAIAPTAADNCAGTITGTTTTVFPITAQGTTVVTWTFDDGNGNTSTATQNVIVEDITAPAVPTLADVTAECSATAIAPTATDNCAGIITGTTTTVFPITAQGTTVVTWTFDDGKGNTSTQTQNVVITDVTSPVADVAALTDITECYAATPIAPTATDICAGTISGTADVTFPITTMGSTTVTWTYDDGNGNTSTQVQDVFLMGSIDVNVDQLGALLTASEPMGTYQWLDCDDNYSEISGETNQDFTASVTGNYAVKVTMNGCSDTSACITVDFSNLNELPNYKMSIYPNPNSGQFVFETNDPVLKSINLIETNGKMVLEAIPVKEGKNDIDLNQVQKGSYFLQWIGTNGTNTKLILIK